jgi:ABC-type polysaccharide/polyol phosphate export permease
VPYPVYIYAALLPWLFLQSADRRRRMSLVNNQPLLSKSTCPGSSSDGQHRVGPRRHVHFSSLIFGLMIVFYMIKSGGKFTPSGNIVCCRS